MTDSKQNTLTCTSLSHLSFVSVTRADWWIVGGLYIWTFGPGWNGIGTYMVYMGLHNEVA